MSDTLPMPLPHEVEPGVALLVRDVHGEWLHRVAVSGVHNAGQCDECGRHDFAIVRVAHGHRYDETAAAIPWPWEDVRLA